MGIDKGFKSFFSYIVYAFAGMYAWVDSTGLSAYLTFWLAGFTALDFALGFYVSTIFKETESQRARAGLLSKSVMFLIPLVIGVIWGYFDRVSMYKVINVVLSAMLIAEGISVIGHGYTIRTREKMTEFDAITYMFKSIGAFLKSLFLTIMNKNFGEKHNKNGL